MSAFTRWSLPAAAGAAGPGLAIARSLVLAQGMEAKDIASNLRSQRDRAHELAMTAAGGGKIAVKPEVSVTFGMK